MKKNLIQILSVPLYILWLVLFAFQIWAASRHLAELRQISNRVESSARKLESHAAEIQNLSKQIRSKSEELDYLVSLLNILPQNKSYLRTQKVITDEVESLRRQVSRYVGGRHHVLIDSKANKLYLKKGLTLLWQSDCSVGRGGILIDKATGRKWEFVTPRGEFRVLEKKENPPWVKPDWAFVEAGEPVPPPEDPLRRVEGELGAYLLNLGDGYLIHGTKNEELLGRAVSHGCVRLGAADLENLYKSVPAGTKVYIY